MMSKKKKIEELFSRGVEQIINKPHLRKALASGRSLRIKHGIDPTGPKIHIGRAAQFLKLRDFQEFGHTVVLIIGDFTALIGDASDKPEKRKPLSEKAVKENMKDYLKQIGMILDVKKAEVRHNSEWLNELSAKDLLGLAMNFTAQQMIQRRNFKERWDKADPIGLHEVDYPLLQGYDSVKVRADVEIGGFDQLFNLNIGRDMQRIAGQEPQDIVALKMLYGPDGRKMSTSWGNVINITDTAQEQFGKIMSMRDELVFDYFELCTRVPVEEIKELREEGPRDAKARLAKEIVSLYHGKAGAVAAEKEFDQIFRKKELPSEIEEVRIKENKINILDLLLKTKLAFSKSEAKRLVLQGGVRISKKPVKDWKAVIEVKNGIIVQVGKRNFAKIVS